jgi:hypothetical protein
MATTIHSHPARMPPTRIDGKLHLAAELEWLVSSDDLGAVEAAIPRECRHRYGETLILRFGNAVGHFDGGPLGPIVVHSGKWGEADFDAMLGDITNRMALLPFAADCGAQLPYDRSISTDRRVLYHAFVYLRHIMSASAPQHEQLIPALRVVVAQPHRGFERVLHWSPLDRVRRVEPRSLLGLFGRNAELSPAPGSTLAVARGLHGHLPIRLEEDRVESTIDVAENRFVKAFLDQASGIVDAMDELARARSDGPFVRRVFADCDHIRRELGPIRQHAMWREVSEMRRLPGESQVLQRRRGYKHVYHHFVRLRLACRLPLRDASRMLEIKDIAELYEMWCFFEVERYITRVLGQPPHEATAIEPDDFGARLERGLKVAWHGGIELFYNLSFARSNAKHRSYSLSLRPDIVLRIATGPAAGDHILDAKFKVRQLVTTKAVDDDEELDPDLRRGVFKPVDIYKMHTYRDALPRTRSAWILYPGSEFVFFDVEHGRLGSATELRGTALGVGAIGLVPSSSTGQLDVVLSRLLV